MGLTFLTGYILGQHGTQSARVASAAAGRQGPPASELLDLHERVDRLVLVVDALWSLLEDSGYSDEQLLGRIQQLDLVDGELDGRRTPRAAECRGCGAMVAPGLSACQFCGSSLPTEDADPFGRV